MSGWRGRPPTAARRIRAEERQARSRRLFRHGALLAACGLLLQAGVLLLDRLRGATPAAPGLRDALYFAGSAIALLLLAAAGVMVWRSTRLGAGVGRG